jgi:hypothetical protein
MFPNDAVLEGPSILYDNAWLALYRENREVAVDMIIIEEVVDRGEE